MALLVRLFGNVEISRDGVPIKLKGQKPVALLAYLMVTGKAHSRQHLVDLLYDESGDPRASLRYTLTQIRQMLGADYLLSDRQQIEFNREKAFWLDVNALIEEGHSHLYRGDFLEDVHIRDAHGFTDWVFFERERLREAYRNASQKQLETFESTGAIDAVIKISHQLIRLDNLNEAWHRALMRAYMTQGNREAALAQYETCRRLLASELGVEPDAETRDLYQQLQAGTMTPRATQTAPTTDLSLLTPLLLTEFEAFEPLASDFVGRKQELDRLSDYLDMVVAGKGQLAFIAGEAGRGKTALLHAFIRQAQEKYPQLLTVLGNCNAYTGVGDPYLPFREVLDQLTGDVEERQADGSIDQVQVHRLWEMLPTTTTALIEFGPDLLDTFVQPSILMARAADHPSNSNGWQTQLDAFLSERGTTSTRSNLQQYELFEQYTRVLKAVARRAPLLIVLDDLQWADLGSISLLFHIGRRLAGSRILILGAYRPVEVTTGRNGQRHPLESVINELHRQYGDITLDLGQGEAQEREFIELFLDREPNQLGRKFRDTLYQQTGGNPLFTIELLRGMQDRGDLLRDAEGRWVEGPNLDWKSMPVRVEAAIGERIGRLAKSLQDMLQMASVEGDEFTAEVVAHMVTIDERSTVRQLSRDLDKAHRLIQAQGIIRLALSRLSRYRFRHIMIQKYLYSGLDEAERAYLHEAVGNVLEQLYKDDTERIAVQLARHFHIAGLAAKAIGYLQQAGEQAAQRYAYHEAITHFKDALTALDTLPQTPELIRQELSLQFAMGRALTAIKGMADAETGAAFDRCRSLAQEVGDVPERFPILFGVWSNLLVRGNIKAAHELGQEFLHLAQAQEETVPFLVGHRMLGFTAFLIGDFPGSRTEFEQAMAIPQTDEPTGLAALYSMDPWVARVTMVCCNLLLLGHPDQALAMSAAALQAAEKSSHPYTMAYTLLAAGAWFHQYRQDAVLVLQHAEALISLSRTHGFQFWLAWGNFLRGWALSVQGEPGEGIPLMREGLHSFQNTGAGLMLSHFQALLAEVYGQIGQTEAGLTVLADGLNTVALNDEHFWEAELLRLRGELLLQQGVVDEEEVEQQFQLAVSLAQRQQAKLLELRALASWSRLRISQGRGPHPELAIVIDWFDEGLDSADLVQAKALLDSH